ncbi:MAG: TraB/GumN family protein [Candidatus Woesearchaeota archaeon]
MTSVLERLTIVPVSHVARESIHLVRKTINEENPDIIAVELCRKRLEALMEREKERRSKKRKREKEKLKFSISNIRKIGLKGLLFGMIASFIQNRIGKSLQIEPGSEMLEAVNLALKNNKQLVLVDQDIEVTLKKLSKSLTFKEKLNFLIDLVKGIFGIGRINFDLNKVPEEELIDEILVQIKERYPGLYKVLVEERNNFIAKRIFNLLVRNKNSKVVAVLGAGHKKEIINIIKELEKKLLENKIEFSYSFSL